MTLLDIIRKLDSFDEDEVIYAAEPFSADSAAIVAREPESGGLATAAQQRGMNYFLEVFVAREFLRGWATNVDAVMTVDEKCARIIQYAIMDA